MELFYIGAGLSIGLSGLGVGLGQGLLAKKSIEVVGKNPELSGTMLVYTILGLALVESAAIYALVVAFKIIGLGAGFDAAKAIGAGLAMGLTGFSAGLGEGMLVAGAMGAILRNPDAKGKILQLMVLFLALIEVVAIYGLIISFSLLS